jgi:fructokinase
MRKVPVVACFGEILWDVFPDKSLLGGAPLNVAMRLRSLGAKVFMISSVGADDIGAGAIEQIVSAGVSAELIEVSKTLPTGTVQIRLSDGIPNYTIQEKVAWDQIPVSENALAVIRKVDALVFGSLAMRAEYNYRNILDLIQLSSYAVFDLNLRDPYYDESQLLELMRLSQFVKMNDEELEFVCSLLEITSVSIEEQLSQIAIRTNTSSICVTLGSEGAILLFDNKFYKNKAYPVVVSDTVGAGDSFLAALVYGILNNDSPEQALAIACAYGALVASKEGANCLVTMAEVNALIS